MENKNRLMRLSIPVFLIGAAGMLLYVFGMFPLFNLFKANELRNIFSVISDMELSAIATDEEDSDILEGYRDDGLAIVIADENLSICYSSRIGTSIEAHQQLQAHIDEYQEKPTVHVRRVDNMEVIRLRGLVQQEQKYYVSIRKEIRSVGEIIRYSVIYFTILLLFNLLICHFWLYRRVKSHVEDVEEAAANALQSAGEQLTKAQKEFVANISHELKTPLAVISGQVELLQNMGSEIDQDYYFSSIREEIDKMTSMVGNLLDITIIDHKIETMEFSDVDLSSLMDYMVLKYDALFRQRRIRVNGMCEEKLIVRGNRSYLEQAVNNYIMNAFQRTPQGKEVQMNLTKAGNRARISIYNEGSSIPDWEKERIWESYYTRAERGESGYGLYNAGLGLYTVRKIVEQHHGSCGAENKEMGVEFWIELPL